MNDFEEILAYPAEYVVHWPGKDVNVCARHKEALERIASAMGLYVSWTQIQIAAVCTNCKNEAENK